MDESPDSRSRDSIKTFSENDPRTSWECLTCFGQGFCSQLSLIWDIEFLPDMAKGILGIKRHSIFSAVHVRLFSVRRCHNLKRNRGSRIVARSRTRSRRPAASGVQLNNRSHVLRAKSPLSVL